MFIMIIRLVILSSILIQFSVSFQTTWDDNRDERQSRTVFPSTPTTTTTTSPPLIDPLFDSSPCYLNTCEDSIIQAIRSGPEFIDQIRCHQLDTQCHCCLRSQLNRAELEKLYRLISSSLMKRSRSSSSSSSSSFSSSSQSSSSPSSSGKDDNRICKVLSCDDYQVKAIKSLDDPNSECHFHGNPGESECECCVKSLTKSISSSSSSSTSTKQNQQQQQQGSTINNNDNNNSSLTRNFIGSPFDLESNFFDFFSPSSKKSSSKSSKSPPPPSSLYDSSSSNSDSGSSSSSSNLFDVDCLHHNCNGPQVKAIKRFPSQVITCIKMGNSDDCKCCFNSSLSIFERVKYEIELTNLNRVQQSPNRDSSSSSYTPQSPPTLSRRSPSPSYSSSPSSSSSFFQPNLDCSLHHCQSGLVQLIRSIPTNVVQCSTINDYFNNNNNNNHCKCCIDSTLSDGLNLRNFLQFINL